MKIVAGLFFALFLTIALLLSAPAIYRGYQQTGELSLSNAFNGGWTSLYDTEFSDVAPMREGGLTLWGVFEFLVFEDGRKGVLIGEDGWLFTDEEFEYSKDRDEIYARNLKAIGAAHQVFQADDVELIIALIPAKARVEEARLGRYSYPVYNHDIYAQTLSAIRELGISASDLHEKLSNTENAFLKTDTHWSPIGARAVSDVLSETVFLQAPPVTITLKKVEAEDLEGDLKRYVPAGSLLDQEDLAQEKAVYVDSTHDEASLFGEITFPVALVGTSYSADTRWNFEAYLRAGLQANILNASDKGHGPFKVMRDYLVSDTYTNSKPEVVIWEIPERYLVLPEKDKG